LALIINSQYCICSCQLGILPPQHRFAGHIVSSDQIPDSEGETTRKEPLMPTVQDVLDAKGSMVHSIDPSATVLEATQKMNQDKLGALMVMAEGQVAGIFTERDVLRRVVAEQRDPSTCTVGEVMTSDVICCKPQDDLDEISALMQQKRVRHVPVCDSAGRIRGLISIGDVNAYHASKQEAHINFLSEYIYGRV
jgi:CBS domain-containing protein